MVPQGSQTAGVSDQPRSLSRPALVLSLALAALFAALTVGAFLLFNHTDLHAPLHANGGDELYVLSVVKTIVHGHSWPWWHPSLGAPSGADWRDFPAYQWIEYGVIWALSACSRDIFWILNMCWLISILFSATSMAYCLWRLGCSAGTTTVLSLFYAFQPYTYARNTAHLNLVHYAVPLLCLAALELALGRLPNDRTGSATRKPGRLATLAAIPPYAWIACAIQGVSYIYYSFFACVLFLVAGALGSVRMRTYRPIVVSGILVTTIGIMTLVGLSPSILYRLSNGPNSAASYKLPAEAEIYGLKIRHLVTPVPENPIGLLRNIASRLDSSFPNDNENATARLGTVGSIGFAMCLLSIMLVAVRSSPAAVDSEIVTDGLLILTCLALATVGGLGAMFNTFVSPQIRCYNRIVVFIEAFSLFGVAAFIKARERGWSQRLGKYGMTVCLVGLGLFGVLDEQRATAILQNGYVAATLKSTRLFVGEIEQRLGGQGAIFQIPYSAFPVDGFEGKMQLYEHARPYLFSDRLRWSWGAFMGRSQAKWSQSVSQLPLDLMVGEICRMGFSGLWVDRNGYSVKQLETIDKFAALAPDRTSRSRDGSLMFLDLRGYQGRGVEFQRWPEREDALKDKAAGSCDCNIDAVRGFAELEGNSGYLHAEDVASISGWVADVRAGDPGGSVSVILSSTQRGSFAIGAERINRPDVVAAFSMASLQSAGFVGAGRLSGVPPGQYTIHVRINGSKTLECDSGRTVTIR